MNAVSHPHSSAITGTVSGATMAPTFAPELKIPVAKARSFFGKYSAVALIAAGKLPASPSASTQRQTTKAVTLTIEICATRSAPCARRNASAFSRPTHRLGHDAAHGVQRRAQRPDGNRPRIPFFRSYPVYETAGEQHRYGVE